MLVFELPAFGVLLFMLRKNTLFYRLGLWGFYIDNSSILSLLEGNRFFQKTVILGSGRFGETWEWAVDNMRSFSDSSGR
jgi:hypothetical protein